MFHKQLIITHRLKYKIDKYVNVVNVVLFTKTSRECIIIWVFFLSDVTKSNFLIFADPFHKQLYQIDFTDSDPSPEGIHLPDSINYPEYFDIDVEAKVLYYANKLDKVITSLGMQDWRDRSIKQFNYGKSLLMHRFNFLKNIFWRTYVLFVAPLIPLFWTSGDVSSGFQPLL